MLLAGIDLAWQSQRNSTGVAIGALEDRELVVERVDVDRYPLAALVEYLGRYPNLYGVAVDAPLIIRNRTGQRSCERLIGRAYGSRKASCHTSNLRLYPNALGSQLSEALVARGFDHLGSGPHRWQLECYPHPALIEIFGLSERHAYKKGRVADKRRGQVQLGRYLAALERSPVLQLHIRAPARHHLEAEYIASLRGTELKANEDVLDAIVCLYIAGLYARGVSGTAFGDTNDGYIYVPQHPCL